MTARIQLPIPPDVARTLRRGRMLSELSTAELAEAAGVSPELVFIAEHGLPLWDVPPDAALSCLRRIWAVLELPDTDLEHLDRYWREAGALAPPDRASPGSEPATLVAGSELTTSVAASQAGRVVPTALEADPTPTASRAAPAPVGSGRRHRRGPGRLVGAALAVTSAGVIGTAVAVVAVPGIGSSAPPTAAGAAMPQLTQARSPARSSAALHPTGPDTATFRTTMSSYRLTVTAVAPCWVQVTGNQGQSLWAGILETGRSRSFSEDQPVQVQLGSSGGRVTVTSGHQRAGLRPPVAPYTYTIG